MSEHERNKWDARYRAGRYRFDPSPFLLSLDPLLPHCGRVLDIAGGDGRHALWLAQRGLSVTLIDISQAALDLARESAQSAGVEIELIAADLDECSIPAGPWDVILVFNYLKRPLYQIATQRLKPGGLLVSCQPTHSTFADSDRPVPSYVLEDGELPTLLPDNLDVLLCEEGELEPGRYQARLVGKRKG